MKLAQCHPDRKHFAKGFCSRCYNNEFKKDWVNSVPAKCHPDRPHKCKGLCNECYTIYKNSKNFRPEPKIAAVNTCGHPDKPHVQHGMCGACVTKARRDANREKDRLQRRDYWLRKKYGISIKEFDELFMSQGFVCALCEKSIPDKRHRHVDHCHSTGRVRGILCFNCNKSLGMLGDTPRSLEKALAYLNGERIAAQAGVFIPLQAAA